MSSSSTVAPPSTHLPSPPARRAPSSTWRDPRMAIGIALVAVSVLTGVMLFENADDTVSVWAVRADLPRGAGVGPDDLQPRQVRFPDAAAADKYVPAGSPLPSEATLVRAVGAGELLPRAALRFRDVAPLLEVPLAVAADAVPATVRAGSVVDVWVAAESRAGEQRDAELVFDDVTVVAAPRTGSALGPSVTRQVIVGLDPADEARLAEALSLVVSGTLVIVRQA